MQSSRLWGLRRLGLLLLILETLLVTAANGETPTYSQCRPHIEATIQELANKAQGTDLTDIPLHDSHPEALEDAEETPPAVTDQLLEEDSSQEETFTEPEESIVEEPVPAGEAEILDEEAEAVSEELPVEEEVDEEITAPEEIASEDVSAEDEESKEDEDDEQDSEEKPEEEELDDVDGEKEDEVGVEHDDDDEEESVEDDDEDKEEGIEEDSEEDDISAEREDETEDADVDRESAEEKSEEEQEDVSEDEHDAVDDDEESESEEMDVEESKEVEEGQEVKEEEEEEKGKEVEDDAEEEKGEEEEMDKEEEKDEQEVVGDDKEEEEEEEKGESEEEAAEVPQPEVVAESEPEAASEPEPDVTDESEPEATIEAEVKEPEEPTAAEPEATETAEVEETSKPSELEEPMVETPEPKETQPPAIQLSLVDKFIDLIFGGVTTEPRDPKWAKPWQTHKESAKAEPAPVAPAKVGGFFSRGVNKFVSLVFGEIEEGERDPKWAQPWQTHKSLPEKPVEKKKAPVKVDTSSEQEEKRDPKWSKPWQTHKDLEAETQAETPVKKEKKVKTPEDFVRDPKWAEPWQTHKDMGKAPPAKEEPKPKKISSGGFVHSFISLFFGAPKEERDPKWAEPWHSHREEGKDVEKPKPAASEKPKTERDPKWSKPWQTHEKEKKPKKPDVPKSETPKVERDPKWSQPWQTHHADKEKPKKAPKPSAPKVERDPKWSYPWQMHKQLEEQAKAGIPIKPRMQVEAEEAEAEAEPEQHEEPVAAEVFPSPEVARRAKETTEVVGDQRPDVSEAAEQPLLEEVEEEELFVIEEEEDPEQIIVVPAIRSRHHLETILGLDEPSKGADARIAPVAHAVLKDLKDVYDNAIKPLEALYKYQDISNRHVADAEIFGTPMILLLGPYSTGKSSFINYLLGTEYTKSALKTGLPPSHGVFRILQYGESEHEITGTDISANHAFSSLQKFGQNFIDQLSGKVLTNTLLKKVTLVETPGILEMRRSNERLYPLNDVLQWFIDRADLILVMFDYTKLDAGYEMEAIFDQLKGREAQTRILLNKADQVPPEELIKVQGSLFWNLSPLLGVASPPTVYAGSFSSNPYKVSSPVKLFKAQEVALLTDIANAINSKVDNRIAIARRHAVRVRNHAQMVDNYLATYYRNKGFLTSKHKLSEDIIENPHVYNIYEGMSLLTNVSRYDLPDPEVYRDFFRIHNMYDFPTLKETCSYMRGCPLSKIDAAISTDLPALLSRFHRLASAAGMPQSAHVPTPMPPMPSASRAAPPPPSTTS